MMHHSSKGLKTTSFFGDGIGWVLVVVVEVMVVEEVTSGGGQGGVKQYPSVVMCLNEWMEGCTDGGGGGGGGGGGVAAAAAAAANAAGTGGRMVVAGRGCFRILRGFSELGCQGPVFLTKYKIDEV